MSSKGIGTLINNERKYLASTVFICKYILNLVYIIFIYLFILYETSVYIPIPKYKHKIGYVYILRDLRNYIINGRTRPATCLFMES